MNVGDWIALAVGCGAVAIAIWSVIVAHRANGRAEEANKLALEANKIARESTEIARQARQDDLSRTARAERDAFGVEIQESLKLWKRVQMGKGGITESELTDRFVRHHLRAATLGSPHGDELLKSIVNAMNMRLLPSGVESSPVTRANGANLMIDEWVRNPFDFEPRSGDSD